VTQIRPQYARAHYVLGDCYVLLGQQELALDEYRKLKGLDAKMAANLLSLISETKP